MKKEMTAKQEAAFSNERAVFDKPVKAQRGTIHKVVAQGVTIEFTDRLNSAAEAYKTAQCPKQWFAMGVDGVKVMGNQLA